MKNLIGSLFLIGTALAVTAGCGEDYECDSICEKYQVCAGEYGTTAVDKDACVDQCEARAEQSDVLADDAKDCQECLEKEQACTVSIPCAQECSGFVPPLAPQTPPGGGDAGGGDAGGGDAGGGDAGGGASG